MQQSWDDLLLAFLHDPPDKALDTRGQTQRACRYASAAAGRTISAGAIEGLAEQLVAIVERVPLPAAGEHGVRNVEPRHGRLTVFHPLSGERSTLAVGQTDEAAVQRAVAGIVSGLDAPRDRFLAVWRLLPQRLAGDLPWMAMLPADARIPDHSIWHHLDAAAGLRAAAEPHGAAFLSLALGPAPTFVEAAQSVHDLRSGSFILSWLAFQAMLPIVQQLGPAAVLYPSLRGVPLLDLWLCRHTAVGRKLESLPTGEDDINPKRERGPDINPKRERGPDINPKRERGPDTNPKRERGPEISSSLTLRVTVQACLPNRCLAIVPWGAKGEVAQDMAGQCETALRRAWTQLTTAVHDMLDPKLRPIAANWDKRWQEQIEGFLEIRTATLPLGGPRGEVEQALAVLWGKPRFADAFPQAADVRKLADAIPDGECPASLKRTSPVRANSSGLWQAQVELSARLLECQQSVCHLPPPTSAGSGAPPKCNLLGSYEQMGPDGFEESRKFWEKAQQALRGSSSDDGALQQGERLCAVALVRRFAEAAFFAGELGTVPIFVSAKMGLSPLPAQFESLEHFAVLAMDGDDLGGWLSGANSPPLRDVLHPDLRDYFAALDGTSAGLAAPRPVGPALHAAVSQAQTNFALHVAPRIVERHGGMLIYCGGGDLLALLPSSAALACAHELRLAYSGDPRINGGARSGYFRDDGHDLLVMGARATASAGLAVAHGTENLHIALAAARKAVAAAKEAGRDIVQIVACRQAGECVAALCPWEFADTVQSWVEAFAAGACDRWASNLREGLPTLAALGDDAVLAELRRQIGRMEEPTREAFPPDGVAAALDAYRRNVSSTGHPLADRVPLTDGTRPASGCPVPDTLATLEEFVSLCQMASFLAKGER